MKKTFLAITLLSSTLLLTACNGDNNNSVNNVSNKTNTTVQDTKEKQKSEKELIGTTYEGTNGTYTFKNIEYLTGKYSNEPILAITIDYTNTTDDNQNPWFAFAFDVSGQQETDKTVETLLGANGEYPEDYKPESVEMSDKEIKPGATVEVVVGYQPTDPNSPIYLRSDSKDFDFEIEPVN